MLLAKANSERRECSKRRSPCFCPWDFFPPREHPLQLDRCSRQYVLEMRFRFANVARAAHPLRFDRLGNGSFDTGACRILRLKLFGLLSLSCSLQRFLLRLWMQRQFSRGGATA